MKEDAPILYPNERVGARISQYAQVHSTQIPNNMTTYHERIRETMPQTANYMLSVSQAQAMYFLAKMINAKRVLEIGVYVGFSSLVWSHAVGPQGKVTGLEYDASYARTAQETFQSLGVKNVDLVVGDALASLAQLAPKEPYDIIFIDAQKSGYPAYLDAILSSSLHGSQTRLLREGGLIVGDNVLRCGLVADDSEDNPWRGFDFGPSRREYWRSDDVKALRVYNGTVAETERLENWLCPLWDGVNIARLVD